MPLSMMNDPEAMRRYMQYMQMVQGMPQDQAQNYFDQMPMMMAAGGASGQTERALRMDPDLGGTGGYPAQAGGTSPLQALQGLGNDPTRRVTPEEYQKIYRLQKAQQDAAYQRWIESGKGRRR
jgi:hypothetical protein